MEFTIEWICNKIKDSSYYFSLHGDRERQNDNLTFHEIEETLKSGKIIEWYEDSGRGKSCLVAGFTDQGIPVHTVCGERGDMLVIITVYIPKPPKFINPFERM